MSNPAKKTRTRTKKGPSRLTPRRLKAQARKRQERTDLVPPPDFVLEDQFRRV